VLLDGGFVISVHEKGDSLVDENFLIPLNFDFENKNDVLLLTNEHGNDKCHYGCVQ